MIKFRGSKQCFPVLGKGKKGRDQVQIHLPCPRKQPSISLVNFLCPHKRMGNNNKQGKKAHNRCQEKHPHEKTVLLFHFHTSDSMRRINNATGRDNTITNKSPAADRRI